MIISPDGEFGQGGQMLRRIAVLTSGGDSPGMNACIRAVSRAAAHNGLECLGAVGGFSGLVKGEFVPLPPRSVSNIIQRGGTILKAGRCPEFLQKRARASAARNLSRMGIGGLVAIGGDGTFRGVHALCREHGVQAVSVPGTIDNDIPFTDSIGFDTAVNTAMQSIDKIKDTSISHGLPFFVEVMGRRSGAIALESAIASGAEAALLPEVLHDMKDVCRTIREGRAAGKASLIVVVAEGDETGGARRAGEVAKLATGIDYRVCVLGHTQRGGSPTVRDRVLATRLGCRAVEELMRGTKDSMAGEENGVATLVPLARILRKRKEVRIDDLGLLRTMSE